MAAQAKAPVVAPARRRFAIDRLSPDVIAAADQHSARTGVGIGNTLIASGHVTEEAYLMDLAAALGVPFERLENVPRDVCPLPDDRLIDAPRTGLLPLNRNGESKTVVAPRLVQDVDRLRRLAPDGDFPRRIYLTSAARLQRFVATHAHAEIMRRAVDELRTQRPDLSAGPSRRRAMGFAVGAALVLMVVGTALQGYSISMILGLVGLIRRRLLRCAWALLLIPIYWILLSVAVWRALYQLVRDPYRWEKTAHGLARRHSSLRAPRDSAATRPRPLRASA